VLVDVVGVRLVAGGVGDAHGVVGGVVDGLTAGERRVGVAGVERRGVGAGLAVVPALPVRGGVEAVRTPAGARLHPGRDLIVGDVAGERRCVGDVEALGGEAAEAIHLERVRDGVAVE